MGSICSKNGSMQIFSDGTRLAAVIDGYAYLFEAHLLSGFDIQMHRGTYEVTDRGDLFREYAYIEKSILRR